ncbi:MAG TPA: alcohol dehydrogenase catalytic domain-containing protein, partial [Candidatus Deferrimicrobium sp.]|nr:alcohol dehydrogenase catalytic domain-containing protein [Candidatus Deferrimicrobium sp.]
MSETTAGAGRARTDPARLTTHPPVGEVPDTMLAQVIRPERYGDPQDAFAAEEITTPTPGRGEALVYVMAAGVNYNNVWAALGRPVDVIAARRKAGASEDFHIGGSDASGVVYAVGEGVDNVAVGDEVVVHCGQWDTADPFITAGGDPIT